jgi:hypothetical protein
MLCFAWSEDSTIIYFSPFSKAGKSAHVSLWLLTTGLILEILKKHCIMGYIRYVENILMVYNMPLTQTYNTLDEFKNLYSKL